MGYDILCHNVKFRYANGITKKIFVGPRSKAKYINLLYKKNCFITSAMVCNSALIRLLDGFKVDKLYNTAEDYDLWLRLVKLTNNIYFINEFLGENFIHQDSASANAEAHLLSILAVISAHHVNMPQKLSNRVRFKRQCSRCMISAGLKMIKKKETSDVMKIICRALCIYPFNLKGYMAFFLIVFKKLI